VDGFRIGFYRKTKKIDIIYVLEDINAIIGFPTGLNFAKIFSFRIEEIGHWTFLATKSKFL
jgi:hypothetical protein